MRLLVATILLCTCANSTFSQSHENSTTLSITDNTSVIKYKSDRQSSEMSIVGTSTLHDWESDVESFKATANRNGDQIQASLEVDVYSIKSGKKLMDNNTYKALKADQFPTILLSSAILNIKDNHKISGVGDLTVAGVKKKIPISIVMESWVEETLTIIGEIPLKMTDFDVEPPIALFGTVKTGDEITIKFNITLQRF